MYVLWLRQCIGIVHISTADPHHSPLHHIHCWVLSVAICSILLPPWKDSNSVLHLFLKACSWLWLSLPSFPHSVLSSSSVCLLVIVIRGMVWCHFREYQTVNNCLMKVKHLLYSVHYVAAAWFVLFTSRQHKAEQRQPWYKKVKKTFSIVAGRLIIFYTSPVPRLPSSNQ